MDSLEEYRENICELLVSQRDICRCLGMPSEEEIVGNEKFVAWGIYASLCMQHKELCLMDMEEQTNVE